MSAIEIATTTISVFTRHSPECPQRENPQWKRCHCRKSLYIYENGKVRYVSARTRSWEQAEKVAQSERDARDPVKRELLKIDEMKAKLKADAKAKELSLEVAVDRWIAGIKGHGVATSSSYQTIKRKLMRWAALKDIENIGEVTSDLLDEWISQWSPDAESKENRLSLTTQGFRLSRIRSFFKWALAIKLIDEDPTAPIRSIKREQEEATMPLTPAQFEQLIEATHRYDAGRRRTMDKFGVDLRATFLVQRWTGLRLVDVLMLPRSGVQGNRIITITQKTGTPINRVVPDVVIEALNAIPRRPKMHLDQFFWSRKCNHRVLAGMWTPRIRLLNQYLSFKNEQGEPMDFHSHMLRDTFAVELLLAGVSIEKVSRLLTHSSVRTTEKHYAPWVKAREEQLEQEAIAAMRKMGATVTS
jgi:site-specific recombinase XerD